MWWVQSAGSMAFLVYFILAMFRYMDPAVSFGDALTPRWVQRLQARRILVREAEAYLRVKAPGGRE
ncbi:hypothetical protein ACFYYB_26400 [Streptomyces sp. NPDC002886]|uniref:hypothetical protein n=1 Tax=Streptomyces sp. NPDC002886 TaxID=3364667 RepID=UPI00369654F2